MDRVAREVIEDAGYGEKFRHRLGHAIGWDVHEPPFLTAGDTTLVQDGMTFTIEPSIFQNRTFSARVEDCIVARPSGGEKLTTGFQELFVVEQLAAQAGSLLTLLAEPCSSQAFPSAGMTQTYGSSPVRQFRPSGHSVDGGQLDACGSRTR